MNEQTTDNSDCSEPFITKFLIGGYLRKICYMCSYLKLGFLPHTYIRIPVMLCSFIETLFLFSRGSKKHACSSPFNAASFILRCLHTTRRECVDVAHITIASPVLTASQQAQVCHDCHRLFKIWLHFTISSHSFTATLSLPHSFRTFC